MFGGTFSPETIRPIYNIIIYPRCCRLLFVVCAAAKLVAASSKPSASSARRCDRSPNSCHSPPADSPPTTTPVAVTRSAATMPLASWCNSRSVGRVSTLRAWRSSIVYFLPPPPHQHFSRLHLPASCLNLPASVCLSPLLSCLQASSGCSFTRLLHL